MINTVRDFRAQCTRADVILQQYYMETDSTRVPPKEFGDQTERVGIEEKQYYRHKKSLLRTCLSVVKTPRYRATFRKSKHSTNRDFQFDHKCDIAQLIRQVLKRYAASLGRKISKMNITTDLKLEQPNEQNTEMKAQEYEWAINGSISIAESTTGTENVSYNAGNDSIEQKEQEQSNETERHYTSEEEKNVYEVSNVGQRADTFDSLSNSTFNNDNISVAKTAYTCEKCNKSYLSETAMFEHTECHMAETTCNVHTLTNPDRLIEPTKNNNKVSEFTCEVCSKIFMDQAKLNSHLRVHGKGPPVKMDKQFLCDICSKTFASRTGLGFHLRTHTGYKPYTCQYCNKAFTISSNKIRHERTHTGDKHFVCHFCSAAFASSNGLKYHLTMHTGETNYHCETCGKSFTRLKYLKEHNFTHTGEKPFVCKICGASYGNSGSLFAHEKKCKAQFGTCLSGINRYNSKETQYIETHGNNEVLYSKMHGQLQPELQLPSNQEMQQIAYLLPPENPCPPEIHHGTEHLVSNIKPAVFPATTWQCFKWSDAT